MKGEQRVSLGHYANRNVFSEYRKVCGSYEVAARKVGTTPELFRKYETGKSRTAPAEVFLRASTGLYREIESIDFLGLFGLMETLNGHSYNLQMLEKETGVDRYIIRRKMEMLEKMGFVEKPNSTRFKVTKRGKEILEVYQKMKENGRTLSMRSR